MDRGIILLMALSLSAQTIAVNGKVTDQSGKAISGAAVTLLSKNLSVTSNASGEYSLKATGVANSDRILPGAEAISLNSGSVMVRLMKAAPLRIELFDMRGNLLERVLDNPPSAGCFRFNVTKPALAAKVMLVRVSIGKSTLNFRYLTLYEGRGGVASAVDFPAGRGLAKAQAIVDTLKASAAGYTAKKVPISSYEATVDIMLDASNCASTPSKSTGATVSGSGSHKVTIETNSDPGINKGTIYRPADLGEGKNYPIFVWGEGGCSQNGYSNKAAMGEIASYGYFIVADGTPGGGTAKINSAGSTNMGDPAALLAYISWAIAENRKPCSAYYQSLDTTKIAADGFSCGGLMAEKASGDPRFAAVGFTSSGLFSADQALFKKIHTPFKILIGGTDDMAYENGLRDYDDISALGVPIILFSKDGAPHGGDLSNAKGDFNTINLAWLNWQLKNDTGATGKALLIGSSCKYCSASGWVFKSKNMQ
jgi:hypothetical protein